MNEFIPQILFAFLSYAKSKNLSLQAESLWIKLLLLSCEKEWPQRLELSNEDVADLIGCKIRLLRKVRDELARAKLITYESRGTRLSGWYIVCYPFMDGLSTSQVSNLKRLSTSEVPNKNLLSTSQVPNPIPDKKLLGTSQVPNSDGLHTSEVPNQSVLDTSQVPNPNPQKQPKQAKNKALQPCSPTHGIINHTSNSSSNNSTSNIFNNNNYINNINTSTTTRTTTTSLIDNTENYAEIYNPKWLEFIQTFEEQIGTLPCGTEFEKLEVFYKEFGHEVMLFAMEYVNSRNPSAPYPYLKKILKNWSDKGVKTLQDAKTASVKYTKPSLQNAPQFGEADLKLMNGECPF